MIMFENRKKIEALEKSLDTLKSSVQSFNEFTENLGDEVQYIEEKVCEIENRLSEIDKDMESYKSFKTEKALLKESDEPWADFETTFTDDGRVKVKMDWNKPFINLLKEQGFKANNEEELVSLYFASLVREAGQELTEEEAQEMMGNG